MTLLELFTLPIIRLNKVRDHYVIRCDSLIRENLPEADQLLIHMTERCLAYSGETAGSIEVEEIREKAYSTVSLDGGFTLTGEAGDIEPELSRRERNIRKNFEAELSRISEVLKDLDESSQETERLKGYLTGNWKEAEGMHVRLLIPEVFEKKETEDQEETVFTSHASSDVILLHSFEQQEIMPVRFIKTEKEEEGMISLIFRVQTSGGVQPCEIRMGCALDENRQMITQITDRIIRSMRWLQR